MYNSAYSDRPLRISDTFSSKITVDGCRGSAQIFPFNVLEVIEVIT